MPRDRRRQRQVQGPGQRRLCGSSSSSGVRRSKGTMVPTGQPRRSHRRRLLPLRSSEDCRPSQPKVVGWPRAALPPLCIRGGRGWTQLHAGQGGSAVQHRCTEAVEVGKEKSFCCFFDAKSCPSLKYVGCYFHQYEILFALHHFCELIHLHFLPFYHVITHRLVSSHVNHAVHWPWAPR